eukprot:UN25498
MQEVEGYLGGDTNYVNLRGDTGPLVYPAGFVYIYALLYYISEFGKNIILVQYLFTFLYTFMMGILFIIYRMGTKENALWNLLLLCISRRIHSIFVLRLFNDCWAMTFLYTSIASLIFDYWNIGCVLYSLAVSIKMNVFLFAPGLWILLIQRFGFIGSIKKNIYMCSRTISGRFSFFNYLSL